jgi:hypothetical protein
MREKGHSARPRYKKLTTRLSKELAMYPVPRFFTTPKMKEKGVLFPNLYYLTQKKGILLNIGASINLEFKMLVA